MKHCQFTAIIGICVSVLFSQIPPDKGNFAGRYGALAIVSIPADAEILINGENTGLVTPAVIESLSAGPATIEVMLPDYLFAERKVSIIPDSIITVSFQLISLADTTYILGDLKLGILRLPAPPITTPYLIDNKQVFSQEITLNAGKHHIVWEGGNLYTSLDTVIEIAAGRLTSFSFVPERLTGRLMISPNPPDAEIYLNDRFYCTGNFDMVLSTGSYHISVSRNGYYTQEHHAAVLPGTKNVFSIELVFIPDRDHDGFLDSVDLCPDDYGLYCGCPEQDRREAFRRYRDILFANLKKQPFTVSVTAAGYLYRTPTNPGFKRFLSYFNDGDAFFNNRNGLVSGNTYAVSWRGFFVSAELGQWFSGLEYKKSGYNPVLLKTGQDDYCIFYKDSITGLNPRITLPSTSLSAGINLHVRKFNVAYSLGHQWENIIITDLITRQNYDHHKSLTDSLKTSAPYTGPRMHIVFNNSHWLHRLRFEYNLAGINNVVPAFFATTTLSFGSHAETGWHTIQAGLVFKFLRRTNKSTNDLPEGIHDMAFLGK